MDLKENLSNKMKLIRGVRSQVAFAKELGISKSTLQDIERQRSSARLDTLEIISRKLKISVGDLLSDPEAGQLGMALQRLDWFVRLSREGRERVSGSLRKLSEALQELSDGLEES